MDVFTGSEGVAYQVTGGTPHRLRNPGEEHDPLTPAQEGMFFQTLAHPHSGCYVEQVVGRLRESLDVPRFVECWQSTLGRHSILRTCFQRDDAPEPGQFVEPQVTLPVLEEDWRAKSSAEQDSILSDFLTTDRARGFDLREAPLMRVALFRAGDADFYFVWTVHHLIVDGRSMNLLLQEVFGRYGEGAAWPDAVGASAANFGAYAAWLKEAPTDGARSYWHHRLEGLCEATSLPLSPPDVREADQRGAGHLRHALDPEFTARLSNFAESNGLTLNIVLLGAWMLLAHRYGDTADVVVGATKAIRHGAAAPADGIGPYINTLPVRTRLDESTTALEWLRALREQWIALRAVEHSPTDLIRACGEIPGDAPLYNLCYVFERETLGDSLRGLGGAWVKRDFTLHEYTPVPLMLAGYGGPSLLLSLEYDVHRFAATDMKRMVGHLIQLLSAFLEHPEVPAVRLDLLPPDELELLLKRAAPEAVPPAVCMTPERFEAAVSRNPEAIALRYKHIAVTYRELNTRANQLARHLRGLGVRAESRVGMCLPHTPQAMVALLGILKAGGAYVPMDPAYPAERLVYTLEDSGATVMITDGATRPCFGGADVKFVIMEGQPSTLDRYSGENLAVPVAPEDLAYIIYTSGSTGHPKGVCVNHGEAALHFELMREVYRIVPEDRTLQFASLSFDVSLEQIFAPLFAGSILHIADESMYIASDFSAVLREAGSTVLNLPPAFWQQWTDEGMAQGLADFGAQFRLLIVGGDVVLPRTVRQWQTFPETAHVALMNAYGPTETVITALYYEVPDHFDPAGVRVHLPIGKPIRGTETIVLDRFQNPLPTGVPGELYIGGNRVARGYHNRPDLTARVFVDHPLRPGTGARLYRTGDRVRELTDGNFEFLGRLDDQVKIRGFRIELREVEATLLRCPGVRDAAVRCRNDRHGEAQLVAYVVPEQGADLNAAELCDTLRVSLPEYMVPAGFAVLDAFPVTVNGKVDYKALPPLEESALVPRRDFVPPATRTQRILAGIWREILDCRDVGIEDSFFHLGGHSLLFTRLLVRIRKLFGVDLPLRMAMAGPTIQAHALAIAEAQASGMVTWSGGSLPIAGRDAPLPLSFAQERLWIVDRMDPGNSTYNIPILFEICGVVEVDRLRRAIDTVVERHEVLRTVFVETGGEPQQVILPELRVPFLVVPLPTVDGDAAFLDAAREHMGAIATESFSLETGPLLRFTYFPHREGHACLVLVIHHTIFDGWSVSVFLDELAACYCAGPSQAPTPPPIQYADYSQWQRDSVATPEFKQQLAYWKEQLAGPLPVLEFPTDFTRPPRQTWCGASALRPLGEELTRELKQLARERGKMLFTVLAAAWNVLLHRYSGQEDILIGSVTAGRTHHDLEGLIGCFVNTVVLRSRLTPAMGFDAYLEELESVIIAAQENQAVPFEQIVAEVRHERDPSRSPLFQIMFVLQNTPRCEAEFAGLRITEEALPNSGAKFDLTLAIQPVDGDLVLNLEYNTALFRETTARRILNNFVTLLRAVSRQPEVAIGRIDMLEPAERACVLGLSGPSAPLDMGASLVGIFEAHALQNPQAPAVADDTTSLAYGELNARANQLARLLIERGVKPGDPVPFFISRCIHTVVAMLGILKAGGAYVPLDLQDPAARRNRVLKVLEPRLILSETAMTSQLKSAGLECVALDEPAVLAPFDAGNLGLALHGEDAAYIIFTSGSTGEPKGVCCNHSGVINLFNDLQARQPVGPGEACSVWAAFSFDATVYETWTGLLGGAALHIVPERVRLDALQCLDWMKAREVASAYLPGYMLPALRSRQGKDPIPLRRLMVGVEPLPESLLGDIVDATPGLVMVNAYGPTEATVYVTLYPILAGAPHPQSNAPIGAAIQNTHLYVLDANMNPVPIGVPGELYAGGAGLARGYYRDPELTAAQFVSNPFGAADADRLYRTGDLVYLRDDLQLQFVRRMGRYIKLRGLRIEPGEIESILRTHPMVEDAAVVLVGDSPEEQRLVAYLMTGEHAPPAEEVIDAFLKDQLPAHMRPAQSVCLPAFPRTVQGKLDRAAFPAPPALVSAGDGLAPQNPTEEAVFAIWNQCLNRAAGGIHTDFFALGGHSLLAIQVLSRINDQFGSALTLTDFFESPTVAGLAKRLAPGGEEATHGAPPPGEMEADQWDPCAVPLQTGGSLPPLFCVLGAGGARLAYGPLAAHMGTAQTIIALQYSHLPEYREFTSVESVALRYLGALRRHQPQGPYYLAGWSFGGLVAYEMARYLREQGEIVALLAVIDCKACVPEPPSLGRLASGVRHALLRLLNRIKILFHTRATLWLHTRDIVRIMARAATGRRRNGASLREYLHFARSSLMNAYALKQAGLPPAEGQSSRLNVMADEFVKKIVAGLTANEQAAKAFEMKPYGGEVTLFRTGEVPRGINRNDATFGFGRVAESVEVVIIEGNHFTLVKEPCVRILADRLSECLARARARAE
ncbi:MAG: amino acid adenylation domain-containing protein [Candidatus Hydrogenedentes bacterium]|nr:amino acid adenylation domain-containing protein [Candidatus Hydrogenedentota bacterium]